MPIVLIWDYLRDDTSLHFTVSLINQTACTRHKYINKVGNFPFAVVNSRNGKLEQTRPDDLD